MRASEVRTLRLGVRDPEGREVCLAWMSPTGPIGLSEEHCVAFRTLVDQVWKAGRLRQTASLQFIGDTVFDWLVETYQQGAPRAMSEHLLDRVNQVIETNELWIPIATLFVQSDLPIGPVTFRAMTREMLASWHERVLSRVKDEEERRKTIARFDQQRQDLLGLAAGTMTITAEPRRAMELAVEKTETALVALRSLATVNLRPDRVSYCTVLGKEHIEATSYLSVRDGAIVSYGEEFLRAPAPWQLSDKEVEALRMAGLDIAAELLFKEERTDFEDSVVNALRFYARSSLETETADRVLYVLASLESLLLKDSTEGIQQNVGERLAFYLAEKAEDRIRTATTFRAVYGRRSSFLHHGRRPSDDPELKDFLRDAWMFRVKIIRSAGHFPTQRAFVESLDRAKFG